MMIRNLPQELQNKIFFYYAEHPCAKMIKEIAPRIDNIIGYPKYFISKCDECRKNGRNLYEKIEHYYVCLKCWKILKVRVLEVNLRIYKHKKLEKLFKCFFDNYFAKKLEREHKMKNEL